MSLLSDMVSYIYFFNNSVCAVPVWLPVLLSWRIVSKCLEYLQWVKLQHVLQPVLMKIVNLVSRNLVLEKYILHADFVFSKCSQESIRQQLNFSGN